MHHQRLRSVALGVLLAVLTACGGGGGGGGSATTTPQDPTTPLGSRTLPGGRVAVTALDPLVAGRQVRFRIVTGIIPVPTTVLALLGGDYGSAIPMRTEADGDGHLARIVLPDPLPRDARVLVRVTLSDGSELETGVGDFGLGTP